jgi:hypothetical protein
MIDIEPQALAGAWRALCSSVLLQGVQQMESSSKLCKPGSRWKLTGKGGIDKELLYQKAHAKAWISGGVGAITFEECCEAMDVDPVRAREKIMEFCRENRRRPVKLRMPGDNSPECP